MCHTPRFELRKENLVLETEVFLEIGDELVEPVIKGGPGATGPVGQSEPGGQATNFEHLAGLVVMVGTHQMNRILDTWATTFADGGKEDQLLLLHMHFHLADHAPQKLGKTL